MSCDLPKIDATITVPAGGWTMNITEDPGGAVVATVAAGDYKMTGPTSLLSALKAALEAAGAGTYTCSCDDDTATATGKITISATGITTFHVTACTAGLQGALGFSSWGSASPSKTSQLSSPYVWLPNCRRGPGLAPDGDVGIPVSDTTCTISPSGATRVLHYEERWIDRLGFGHLVGTKVWKSIGASDPNATLQSFWELAIMLGSPIHYHADRSADNTYVSWVVTSHGRFPATPVVEYWTTGAASLWVVSFDVARYALADYVA